LTDEEYIELAGATMSSSLFEAISSGVAPAREFFATKAGICANWKLYYDEMLKWIITQTGSFGYDLKTEEVVDNTAWKHTPNPAALELLYWAKRFGCKWAQDKEFPLPQKRRERKKEG